MNGPLNIFYCYGLLPIHCHYCFTYNLFSRILCNFSPCFVCLSICRFVACSCRWSSGRCVSILFVKRCVVISCISSSVFLCLFTIKNSQIGNTGIRHNRKKTASPLFHYICMISLMTVFSIT